MIKKAMLPACLGLCLAGHAQTAKLSLDSSLIKAATPAPAAPVRTPAIKPSATAAVTTAVPVPATTVTVPPEMVPDYVEAKKYKVSNRPFIRKDAQALLKAFGIPASEKFDSNRFNVVYRYKGARLIYNPTLSDFAYTDTTVADLGGQDYLPDSLIRGKTDPLVRNILQNRAAEYSFINFEKTLIQKDPQKRSVPAFYYGRYLPKVNGRYVLGDRFQVRVGYGRNGATRYFSQRNPQLTDAKTVKTPSRRMIIDSLVRCSRSKACMGKVVYPFHPDSLTVESLKLLQVFEAYAVEPDKDGEFLVPVVTVTAQAKVRPSKKKGSQPPPDEPVLLHFNFPCIKDVGQCWPDKNRPATQPR